jgi:hypothetical protein
MTKWTLGQTGKTKPIQSQNKANSKPIQTQNEPKTNPIQSQTMPNCCWFVCQDYEKREYDFEIYSL